jgi:hypothetical protein
LSPGRVGWDGPTVVGGLERGGGDEAGAAFDLAVKASVVEPVDVLEQRVRPDRAGTSKPIGDLTHAELIDVSRSLGFVGGSASRRCLMRGCRGLVGPDLRRRRRDRPRARRCDRCNRLARCGDRGLVGPPGDPIGPISIDAQAAFLFYSLDIDHDCLTSAKSSPCITGVGAVGTCIDGSVVIGSLGRVSSCRARHHGGQVERLHGSCPNTNIVAISACNSVQCISKDGVGYGFGIWWQMSYIGYNVIGSSYIHGSVFDCITFNAI